MNKREGGKKKREESKSKDKKDSKGKEAAKKEAKGDPKSKSKSGSDKKNAKTSDNKTKPATKTSSKDRSPSKSDRSAKKSPAETKKNGKTIVNGDKSPVKDKKTTSKAKSENGDAKPSKQSKRNESSEKKSKADKSPSRKSSKSDVSKSKKGDKDGTKKTPEKKSKSNDEDKHKKKSHDPEKPERVKSAKPKSPAPEPKSKTPEVEYEDYDYADDFEEDYADDFEDAEEDDDDKEEDSSDGEDSEESSDESSDTDSDPIPDPDMSLLYPGSAFSSQVLNASKNPDTHTKKLETAVKKKDFVQPTGASAKHMWDADEAQKAMEKENKAAENFDAEAFHKQKNAKHGSSPTHAKPRPASKTVSFIPDDSGDKTGSGPKAVRSINFSGAKKEHQRKKSAQRRGSRGAALLSLIDLYEQEFDLFEMEPASYDQIMANFGKSGMQQGTTQTNEDDLTEEIQTDEIKLLGKWTQHPIQFDVKVVTNKEGEVVSGPTYYDYLGVGGDMAEDEDSMDDRRQSSAIRLNKFLGAAGQCMLMLLEEELVRTTSTDSKSGSAKLSFSSGAARLGEAVASLLTGRGVSHLSFCDTDSKLLVTSHTARTQKSGAEQGKKEEKSPAKEKHAEKGKETDSEASLDQYGLVCLWSLNEPSQPQKVLATSSQPTCCCFSPLRPRLVFAGCEDGSVDVWDLHEPASEHATLSGARSPSYSTAEIHRAEAHNQSLVSLRPVPAGDGDDADQGGEPGSFQMCSLDAGGRLVFWVALSSQQQANLEVLDGDLGLAPWARVKLVKISHVSVEDFLDQNAQQEFTSVHDFRIHPADPSHIYVSTDSGAIVHCTRQGTRATPRLLRPEFDLSVPVRSLALCPRQQPYLLAGAGDGSLRLHSTAAERPLITWNGAADGAPVTAVAWSRVRPCVFFVLDAESKIHVWDLSAGDIFPAESDQVKAGHVTAMDVGYGVENDVNVTHLAVCTDTGTVEVHRISDTYTNKTEKETQAEMDQFLHYVQII